MDYEVRTMKVVVVPVGETCFSERATFIKIADEDGGEFVKVTQEGGSDDLARSVAFDPEEWPHIRDAIESMVRKCRKAT